MSEEVKPCPFCGSEAVEFQFLEDNPEAAAYIECECGARGPLVDWESASYGPTANKLARLSGALADWNKRVVQNENWNSRDVEETK